MIKVNGKYNTANIYASIVEEEAKNQILDLCNKEWAKDSHIAIMADTHAGSGCTIGTSMTLHGKVVPNLVGVDIGCGMKVVELGKINIDFSKLDEVIHKNVPAGKNVFESAKYEFNSLKNLIAKLKNKEYALMSIGTLGGGNHFIEIDEDEEGNKYLVIHSGSRHLGVEVCNYWQDVAESDNYDPKPLIEKLKAEGRQKEIESELIKYKASCESKGYLEGENYSNYLNDMAIAQEYAVRNRAAIARAIVEEMGWMVVDQWETVHNYIDLENNILRKGAVSAQKGEKLLIPMNMRDGSLLCIGKGNKEYNYTAPHGAGRMMSRMKARKSLSVKEFKSSMNGIYSSTVNESTIDEAPMAYKPWEVIKEDIKETVEVVKVIKPVYNFKSSE